MTRFKEAKHECLAIRKTMKRAIRTPFCLCARLLSFVSQVSGEHTAVLCVRRKDTKMEIKINGTIHIEENCAAPADNGNPQEAQTPIDHSKDVLLDNSTTFNELLRVLARNPEVSIAGQLEAEQREQEKREARLREAFGEDYAWVVEKNESSSDAEAREMKTEKQKPKRRPGARQLRQGYPRVAMIEIGKNARVEVFNNGYAIYDNGNRRVVLWAPDCGSAVYYFTGLRDNEKEYLSQSEEIGLDILGELPWYQALMIAGENRIEYNMDHPKSRGNTSDFDTGDDDVVPATHWVGAYHFESPEEAYLKKEAAEERRKALTDKQREAYVMYYEEGMTVKEIGAKLGIHYSQAAKRISRAREVFKKDIEKFF